MSDKTIVLIVGSTGMLGTKIVNALLDKGETEVKAMVRADSDRQEDKRKSINAMSSAIIVESDLMEPERLRQLPHVVASSDFINNLSK